MSACRRSTSSAATSTSCTASIPATLAFERQRQLLGIVEYPAAKAFEEDLAVRCLTFTLVLESEAELKEQGFRATSNVGFGDDTSV